MVGVVSLQLGGDSDIGVAIGMTGAQRSWGRSEAPGTRGCNRRNDLESAPVFHLLQALKGWRKACAGVA